MVGCALTECAGRLAIVQMLVATDSQLSSNQSVVRRTCGLDWNSRIICRLLSEGTKVSCGAKPGLGACNQRVIFGSTLAALMRRCALEAPEGADLNVDWSRKYRD